jgi:beta-lactamase regulating signal transducer with metallopeptidase domain
MTGLTDVLVSLSPTAAILLKVTILLAAGWAVHGILIICQADARWRLWLWRGMMAGLMLVPMAQWLGQWDVSVKRPAVLSTEIVVVTRNEMSPGPVQPTSSAISGRNAPAPNNPNAFVPMQPSSISAWAGERKPQLLLAGWLIGAGVLFIRSWALLARTRWTRSKSRPAGPRFQSLLGKVARDMGSRKRVLLQFAPGVESPFLTGIRRPVIILPDRMEETEYGEDLPGILAHEVAHICAHDLWWMALGRFVSILLWFHPLAWRLRDAHGAACEEVCDAAAAQYVGNPAAYTSTLARVALEIVRPVPSVGGIPMARSSEIISRLRLLERGGRSNPIRRGRLIFCASIGIAALAGVACVRLVYAEGPVAATNAAVGGEPTSPANNEASAGNQPALKAAEAPAGITREALLEIVMAHRNAIVSYDFKSNEEWDIRIKRSGMLSRALTGPASWSQHEEISQRGKLWRSTGRHVDQLPDDFETWDSNYHKHLYPGMGSVKNNVSIEPGLGATGSFPPDVVPSSPFGAALLFDSTDRARYSGRRFEDLVAILKMKDVVVTADKHAGQDTVCVMFKGMTNLVHGSVAPEDNMWCTHKIWLDPKRGYTVIEVLEELGPGYGVIEKLERRSSVTDVTPWQRTENLHFQDCGNGLWLPTETHYTSYIPPGSSDGRPGSMQMMITAKTTFLEINKTYPDEQFDLKIPPGAFVFDKIKEIQYRAESQ